ncbi:hypothetical protein LEP1GSC050_1775 [Leptospira broomii serovar Hurstbridge str. 5399]|uniref:Uncharacterized protein n=1 Tax=Leptospira broomii serovar Hurstbridge str. 5399 TaxID=1049789 RepID=T0F5P5_9LEPT|nr:hypothetical protein [Leptospira broomii]EQA43246.1 hypothetical protein LEP1GSC050_1775 [Leptospira broomii serovar Hurstbridge str. 5399]
MNAAQTEHRLKAIATTSLVDLRQLRRDGLGGMLKSQLQKRMDELAVQRYFSRSRMETILPFYPQKKCIIVNIDRFKLLGWPF